MNLDLLAQKVHRAIIAGHDAADACPNDGGSANLDHVVLYGLKGVREASMWKAGINGSRSGPSEFALETPFAGQANRRYVGVQAMEKSLKDEGVDCYVFYMVD